MVRSIYVSAVLGFCLVHVLPLTLASAQTSQIPEAPITAPAPPSEASSGRLISDAPSPQRVEQIVPPVRRAAPKPPTPVGKKAIAPQATVPAKSAAKPAPPAKACPGQQSTGACPKQPAKSEAKAGKKAAPAKKR